MLVSRFASLCFSGFGVLFGFAESFAGFSLLWGPVAGCPARRVVVIDAGRCSRSGQNAAVKSQVLGTLGGPGWDGLRFARFLLSGRLKGQSFIPQPFCATHFLF